jgi:beta-hydroxylase
VLYKINNIEDNSAYIEVGNVKNLWRENKLFIFDDTLLHQSFNESDKARYCLFVDILRPALFSGVFALVVRLIRFFLRGVNFLFYKNWEVVKN